MTLFARLFLGYVLVLGASAAVLVLIAVDEIKPAMRQSAEEALVDTANLLAELAAPDLRRGEPAAGALARALAGYGERRLDADIWGFAKRRPGYRVYVTDAEGAVVYDSSGEALGEDYSQWRDVYLTLRGRYGARTSPVGPGEDAETVMYVAAPIRHAGEIIGALTVGKPNRAVQPFLDRSRRKLMLGGAGVLGGALVAAWLVALGHSRSVNALAGYAGAVSAGEAASLPHTGVPELDRLGAAVDSMRASLEGKAYVEQYAEVLTHELKSPLAAILAAEELLREPMPPADRERFLDNIRGEAGRMQQVIERLLDLAVVEHRRGLQAPGPVDLQALVQECIAAREPVCERRGLRMAMAVPPGAAVRGERFLLQQAVGNLLDNAMDFTPPGGEIQVRAEPGVDGRLALSVLDTGAGVPDYALARASERFFSLPRPGSGKKSSGLGLSFVARVARLHGGSCSLDNRPGGGAVATLTLPPADGP